MPPKHGDSKRQYVKFMYCTRPISPEELSEETGVSTSTIYRWIKDGNWDDDRTMAQAAPWETAIWLQKLLVKTRTKIEEENRDPTPAETDKMVKWVKSIEGLSGGVHYAQVTLHVFSRFIAEIGLMDENLKKQITPFVTSFVERVTKEKSR